MRSSEDLLSDGSSLAKNCRLGSSLFLKQNNISSEAEFKRIQVKKGQMMQHAHIGFGI